jgi:hypothetical protein
MDTPSQKLANSISTEKEDIEISSVPTEDKEDLPMNSINLINPSPSGKSKKKSNNSSQAIKCFCRIRPIKGENEIFKVRENTEGTVLLVNYDQNLLKKLNNNTVPTFTFSKTFDETSTQIEVFDSTCKNLVEDLVFKKKSGLIFTYGMTCAGKTFTVIGSQSDPGILPLSLKYLYRQFESEEIRGDMSVYCNFVEIYNEEIYDLLSSSNDPKNKFFKKKLIVKENIKKQFFLPEVVYLKISSLEDFNTALNKGIAKKVHAATNLNQNSSRSHTIFKIILKSSNPEDEEISLSIVDLAGSERANRTEAQGKELQEACSINQSLSILGKCMEALRYNSIYTQKKLVPFRESKLTKLFQEYFQGDQNVIMITNINPRREDFEETIRALNYSCIAKEIKPIKSKIVVNPNPMKKQVKLIPQGGVNNTSMNNLNNFSENVNMLAGSMNLMQGGDSTLSSNFTHADPGSTNNELNMLKLEMERMKEEMFYLKSRNNNNNNINQSRNVETENNSTENYNNLDPNVEMNNSVRKFRPYTPYNNYAPRENFATRAFMFQQEMQMAMMTQMMQMMKKITENQYNPYSMFLPNASFHNGGNIQNFQSNFLQPVQLENEETINNSNIPNVNDVQFIPPNSGPLNLVFINSKFNDFNMAQKKKRPVRNKKKKEEDSSNNVSASDIEVIDEKLVQVDEEKSNITDFEEKYVENKENESIINESLEQSFDKSELSEDISEDVNLSHVQDEMKVDNEINSTLNEPEKKKKKKKKKKVVDEGDENSTGENSEISQKGKKKKKGDSQREEPEQEENKKKKRKKKPKPKVENILPEILEIPEQSQQTEKENIVSNAELPESIPTDNINSKKFDEIVNKSNQDKAFSFGGSPIEKITSLIDEGRSQSIHDSQEIITNPREEIYSQIQLKLGLQKEDVMLVDNIENESSDIIID